MSEEIVRLDYEYTPAVIGFDFVGLETKVSELVEPYMGLTEADVAGMDYADAKARRADLNRILKDVEAVRKAVKRQYNEPLAEFESRIREIELQITQPRDLIDGLVKKADEGDKRRRYDDLQRHFYEFLADNGLDVLANSISFDSLLDMKWLNRTTNEVKAKQLLEAKLAAIMADWQTLQGMELHDRKHAEATFLQTLDLRAAVNADTERRADAEKLEEIHRQMDDARQEREAMADASEAEADLAGEADGEAHRWSIEIECSKYDAQRAAAMLRQLGLSGRIRRLED